MRFLGRRFLSTVLTLFGVMLVVLLLVELMRGDPAAIMAGENATPEAVELLRQELDLDRPIYVRFVAYIGDVVTGDLGTSPSSSTSVWNRIEASLPVTLSLAVVAMTIAVSVGVLAGVAAAIRKDRFVDLAVTTVSSALLAIPSFVIGLALVILLAVNNSMLPANGYRTIGDGFWPWLEHLLLPSIALAATSASELARQTRGAMVDTLEQDYIRAARAKGMPEILVIGKHAAKVAAIPVVTVSGLQVARILGGAVVVERIFGMHGFGSLAVSAVLSRDVVLMQGVVLVSAVVVLITNFIVDVSYGWLNPRTRG